jgi:hypothetical protein
MDLSSLSTEDLVDRTFALGMQPCMSTIAASLAGLPDSVSGGLHLPPEVRADFVAEIRRRNAAVVAWMLANPERVKEFNNRETRQPYFTALAELGCRWARSA